MSNLMKRLTGYSQKADGCLTVYETQCRAVWASLAPPTADDDEDG